VLTIAVGSSHAQMPPIGCRCEQLPSAYEKSWLLIVRIIIIQLYSCKHAKLY